MGLIPEWYDENMSVVALMGPCITPSDKYLGTLYTPEVWSCLTRNNCYVIGDPNWQTYRAAIEADPECPQSFKDEITYYETMTDNPIQTVAAYSQTSATGRFQEYTADWFEFEGFPN